jgi:hypothetical protein
MNVSWDLQNLIGEKYCFEHKIVILENSDDALTVALPGKSFPCIDEIRKLMPNGKKLNVNILDPDDMQSLFVKLYDLFGVYRYR